MALKFFTTDRNETGNVGQDSLYIQGGEGNGWKILDYSNGNRGAVIAAGDFDGDGYKDEIIVGFNDNYRIFAYLYKLTFEGGQASVKEIGHVRVHNTDSSGTPWERSHATQWGDWTMVASRQASLNVVTLDFDGDGKDEAAFAFKGFDANGKRMMEVATVKYDTSINKDNPDPNLYQLDISSHPIDGDTEGACKITKCDFDGDGQDELAILFFEERNGALWPRLERWYRDDGSIGQSSRSDRVTIYPLQDYNHKKGGSDTSVLGYYVAGDAYNQYYKIAEDFCITAGPVMGTKGKAKLAEDVVISHVNSDASRVFVIPTQLDDKGDFAGFGDTKKIYENTDADSVRRGAVITADFTNEVLMLGKPAHTVDDYDESYVAVLQTFPYHVDNVDIHGNLTPYPLNYTFSGFTGQEGNGAMNVAYSKVSEAATERDVSFVTTSTTETISILGDAGPAVAGILNLGKTAANLAGNFNPKAKAAAGVANSIMDFITDKIDETTTEGTKSSHQKQTVTNFRTDAYDAVFKYAAAQHIWRYKILNNPLPSWYQMGAKADFSSGDIKAERKDYYLTFTVYDNAVPGIAPSPQTNTYQPIHEEGNLFSYPPDVKLVEGFNEAGVLDTTRFADWGKSVESMQTVTFSKENIDALKYDENITKSELTKTISAIASFFGADDPSSLPPYTSHNESVQKSFSTSERIDFNFRGRSTERGEYAGNRMFFVPYLTREGAMKVAMAVTLKDGELNPLWGDDSLYGQLPDPALLLPGKYKHDGANIIANDIPGAAMELRGMRFYVPVLDIDSDNNLLAGLTYTIRVPIYNASFVEAESFDVRLSYARVGKGDKLFRKSRPYNKDSLQPIQTLSGVNVGGWSNTTNNNKKWLEFTWTVPEDAVTGDCVFYVEIDPDHKLQEVHESRMDANGNIIDSGGNNDGYFSFSITSINDAQKLRTRRSARASMRASGVSSPVLSPRGTIYRAVSRNASGNGEMFSASEGLGNISANLSFGEADNIGMAELLEAFGDGYTDTASGREGATITIRASDDVSYSIIVDITYDGNEHYPEAYLCGYNYKSGDVAGGGGEVDHEFLRYKFSLVPNETHTVVINLNNKYMDYEHGTGFEIVVPELSEAALTAYDKHTSAHDDSPSHEDPSGESSLGSAGGGCQIGAGSFALLGLAVIAFLRTKKHQ